MKTRRGSDYWGNGDEGMIAQFEAGDIVRPAGVSDFIGVVRDVQSKINKVFVAWGGGSLTQHDPDEVQLVPYADASTKVKMASETVVETRRGTKIAADFFAEGDDPEQYVGDPRTHGLDKPRGGGFSIMQNLQKDLAPEALAESKKGPKVSTPETEDLAVDESADQNAPDGDPNKAPEVEVVASEGLKSRRAMYWMDKGRTYRLTKNEQGEDAAMCPKCKGEMEKSPFTKREKLYMCNGCGFKVPSSKVLTERKVEIEIEPDGTVEVEIEPVEEGPREASLKARRGSL